VETLQKIDKPKPPKENIFFRAEPKERLPVGEANKTHYVKEPGVVDKDGYATIFPDNGGAAIMKNEFSILALPRKN
jgi:hypothetical protein